MRRSTRRGVEKRARGVGTGAALPPLRDRTKDWRPVYPALAIAARRIRVRLANRISGVVLPQLRAPASERIYASSRRLAVTNQSAYICPKFGPRAQPALACSRGKRFAHS